MPTEGISSILGAGDSIMYGVGASDVNTKSWMKLLESKIKEFNPSLVVKNVGVGGQNTTEVLNNQIIPEMANKYDVVIIQCGTNNGRLEIAKKTTYDIAIQDLCTMIKLIKSTGAIPIVCTTTPYAYNISSIPSSYDNTSYWYNVKLNGLIRQLCAKEKIRIIDNYSIFNNNLTLLGSDQLHPNDTGQVLMKDNAYNVLFGNFIS
jgi:lysophospholipase L1-like esterase